MRVRVRFILVTALLGAFAVNAVAFMQARSMTQYSAKGARTARPENLGPFAALGVVFAGVNVPRPRNRSNPAAAGLPFDTIAIPSREGVVLEAWRIANDDRRPAVLAFHGYAASKASLLPAARAFHDLGYEAFLVDFYGSGGSSGNDTSLGYLEAADVAAALRYARNEWPDRQVVLYGFSMGTAAILRAIAVDDARPDGIILEATFDSLLDAAKNRFRSMHLPPTPFAELLLFWGGVQWGFDPFAHNPVDYARSVRCPSLILHGEEDVRATPEQAKRVAQAIGEEARMAVYPSVPHMPIVEARPTEWKEDVGDFLGRL